MDPAAIALALCIKSAKMDHQACLFRAADTPHAEAMAKRCRERRDEKVAVCRKREEKR